MSTHQRGDFDGRTTAYDKLAGESQWDEFANRFETDRRLDIVFNRLLADVPLAGKRFLDGGSGGGHFSAAACERGADVTSVDVGENLLAQVARRCDSTRVVASLLDLPFEDESFDVVMSTEVIEHTPDPAAALRSLARVVRKGGVLVVTSPCRLWQPVVRAATRLHLRPYEGYENFLWPRIAQRTLEAAGIVVDDNFGFNLLPLFKERLAGFHEIADRGGRLAPWLYVNFALRGHKAH